MSYRPKVSVRKYRYKPHSFDKIAFPLVRKTFSSLIANEIVSVQPMSVPTGLMFYLDYTYRSRTKRVNPRITYSNVHLPNIHKET